MVLLTVEEWLPVVVMVFWALRGHDDISFNKFENQGGEAKGSL